MAHLLKPNGVITLEFPHLQRLMEGNQFDTIYHEHFSYFSFTTIKQLASQHGLKLIDVEELATHGGSLRVYLAGALSHYPVTQNVVDLLDREETLGYRNLATYGSFAVKVHQTKRDCVVSLLIGIKQAGKRICGYGAPGKGNTLLNYCGIGTDFLDFHRLDRNPQAWQVHARDAYPDLARGGDRNGVPARLHSHSAVEPEARDCPADALCRAMGGEIHFADF